MSKAKPKTEKGSEDGVTGRLRHHQAKSRNLSAKIKILSEYVNTLIMTSLALVPQGYTKLFVNSLKAFY